MSQNLAIERLGIFGGSFDPPHQAHITLAARAIEQLQPYALDVSSGIEAGVKGCKDADKMQAFVHAVDCAQACFIKNPLTL